MGLVPTFDSWNWCKAGSAQTQNSPQASVPELCWVLSGVPKFRCPQRLGQGHYGRSRVKASWGDRPQAPCSPKG